MKRTLFGKCALAVSMLIFVIVSTNFELASAEASSKIEQLNIQALGDGTKWTFTYSQFGFQSRDLQIPVNQKVLITVATVGVNDSLWIPQLSLKIDGNPFQNVSQTISTSKPRKFSIMSINLCDKHNKHMVVA
jgi:heme/copper-type cytochrome/quinol oxidase subunit 2